MEIPSATWERVATELPILGALKGRVMHNHVATYPDLSDNALAVLRKRYFLKDRIDHPHRRHGRSSLTAWCAALSTSEREQGWV